MAKKSQYAAKRESGQQMYGPGCCAHKVTPAEIERARQRAQERGHFARTRVREELSFGR